MEKGAKILVLANLLGFRPVRRTQHPVETEIGDGCHVSYVCHTNSENENSAFGIPALLFLPSLL